MFQPDPGLDAAAALQQRSQRHSLPIISRLGWHQEAVAGKVIKGATGATTGTSLTATLLRQSQRPIPPHPRVTDQTLALPLILCLILTLVPCMHGADWNATRLGLVLGLRSGPGANLSFYFRQPNRLACRRSILAIPMLITYVGERVRFDLASR